jgi:tetratricopeptide (TPR) repeat protein
VPTSEEARRAEDALERLEARTGSTLRTPAEFAERARALSAAGANQEALASFDRALGGDLPLAANTELQRERALTLFRLRRYPEAEAAFAELGEGAEDRFWRARSLARSGRLDESIREFEKLSGGRFDALAARSLLIAGILREDEADRARSLAHYVRVASVAPTSELRAEARWRLGCSAYRGGYEATEHFTALREAIPDPLSAFARYWRARSWRSSAPGSRGGVRRSPPSIRSYHGWRGGRWREPPAPGA